VNQKTPKAELLAKIDELSNTVRMLQIPEALQPLRTLTRRVEIPVQASPYGSVDLREVDAMRQAVRRRAANELADELIRSGAVSFKETLTRDMYRHFDTVRIEATLKVAA
jgi:hypothetical protein